MPKLIRILSIDGGGIRGILPSQILISLEKKLQQKTNDPAARLVDFFDLMAGTSTGGILTALYLFPDDTGNKARFSAEEAASLYLENGTSIFSRTLLKKITSLFGILNESFDVTNLETCLKKYFGATKLSQLLKHSLLTSYDIKNRTPFFFRMRKAKENSDFDFYVWQACRGTSAAPTYFPPALVESFAGNCYPVVDGGTFANNPALCAYAEARQIFESHIPEKKDAGKTVTASEMLIFSIGTGTVRVPYEYNKTKNWGAVAWIRPIIDIMMAGVSDTVDYQLKQMFDAAGHPENYIRIMPDLMDANEDMSDSSPENLARLKAAGIKSAEKFDAELNRIADILCESKKLELVV